MRHGVNQPVEMLPPIVGMAHPNRVTSFNEIRAFKFPSARARGLGAHDEAGNPEGANPQERTRTYSTNDDALPVDGLPPVAGEFFTSRS